jgi:ArsR family transcriptional regulator
MAATSLRTQPSDQGGCAPPATSAPAHDARVIEQLKALAHPVRFRMVDLIRTVGGELCVCAFEPHFDLTQPTISHHLRVLREAGLLRSRQEGSWVHHAIEPEAFERLREMMGTFAPKADDDDLLSLTMDIGR